MDNNVIHKIGRRKPSVGRIYLKKGKGNIIILISISVIIHVDNIHVSQARCHSVILGVGAGRVIKTDAECDITIIV